MHIYVNLCICIASLSLDIYIYIYISLSLCLTRLVAQQADACEAVSGSGFDDQYAIDGCCDNLACPFGHTVRGAIDKTRPDAIVTPVYLVGRSATSGQAIRKILPPDVPKVVLIGLPTRIVAAGIPHYTTINTMWSRTPSLCGRSARCGQAIYPQKFAPEVPKIVLIS
jgi:hypothetical protein